MSKSFNKLALFLATLAIVLIVLLLLHFKGLTLFSKANANELSNEEAISEIYDYIDSLEGFSDAQKKSLQTAIQEYVDNCNYLTQEDLSSIYKLIDDKYEANRTYIIAIRDELTNQLNNMGTVDNSRYEELNKLINELNTYIENTDSKEDETRRSFGLIIQELRGYTDKQDDTMNETLNDLISALTDSTNSEFIRMDEDFNNKLQELLEYTNSQNQTTNNNLNTLIKELSDALTKESEKLTDKLNKESESLSDAINKESKNLNSKIDSQGKDFDDANTAIKENISSLSETVKQNNDDLWAEIKKLNKRTTDNNGIDEFDFGYKDGCYGYYINGSSFKPF